MNAPRTIPAAVLQQQIDASNPAVSAWVAANAGAGKTHVLAQRVIRLLLDGVEPGKILCITFTKAAAANMAKRVFDTLAEWTAFDDAKLDQAIRSISNIRPDAKLRAQARKLFALALETPGGLKMQTIHAFCTRLLHQFPFEADVAARFEVLDGTAEAELLDQVNLKVLLAATNAPDSALGRALATAISAAADQTFKEVIGEAIRRRDMVRAWIEQAGGIDGAIAGLCGSLGIEVADTIERVDAETTDGPNLPMQQWSAVAAALDRGSKSDQEHATRLRDAAQAAGIERADIYRNIFLTGTGEPRKRLVTKAMETADPALAERFKIEQERVVALAERRKAVACRDRTAALITIADAVIARYQEEKDRRGRLDYDDLIDKTLTLLSEERAAWVHYKLDRGIDHVLIDEAQDTSPKQWRIIRALTAEFFAGAGARTLKRTIFAVGDEKQSIFSFQGAAPREFDAMRRAFTALCRAVDQDLQYLPFRLSFRSGPNVLESVDKVFANPAAYSGLSADNVQTIHESLPGAAPGMVEIWETIKPEDKPEIGPWQAPFDDVTETSPQVRLAQKIAGNVARWQQQGARAGDVLVLVRQRGPLFEAIIRALKDAGIAVAGADRLVLTEHIAVMDLMVLADALLLPDDDLALATVLKSPLFGFDDEDLFALAWNRAGSLRAALRAKSAANARFAKAAARLERFAAHARTETPFAFYARVLGPEHGRKNFLARLGAEADDALQEFLNLALDYESRETPSLQGFTAWLRAARTDVKRDMEVTRDEVRVMTVHGAKGLEAPIVILADTTTPPGGPAQRQPKLLTIPASGVPGTPDRFVWATAKAADVGPVSDARQQANGDTENEHRRLLYVAMTRASERLIVCGCDGKNKRPAGCWYDLVFTALQEIAIEAPADDGDGNVWRYCKTPPGVPAGSTDRSAKSVSPAEAPPGWLDQNVSAEPAAAAPLSPASAYDESALVRAVGSGGAARMKALARGTLVHRLLQSLPDIPENARAEAARRHVARAPEFDDSERTLIADQVLKVLDDPRFAELFGADSRAEVPIVGRLMRGGRTIPIAGQVDRLVVTPEAVLIADYKTNSPAPRRIEDVPAYVAQLALYRAVLAMLYPDRPIRAALVWTDVPDLMEISAAALDAALAAVTSP